MSEPLVYAVAGHPVLHSRSPEIFEAGFRAAGLAAAYTRLAVRTPGDIPRLAEALNLRGVNITSPFKESIIPFLDEIDPVAREIGAVNTVVREQGRLVGHNTDPSGVVDSLTAAGVPFFGRRALVIGAGGAARAAVFGLVRSGCLVTVVNRTAARAVEIAARSRSAWAPADRLDGIIRRSEIIVSCLSNGTLPFDPGRIRAGQVVLNAGYREASANVAAPIPGTFISGREWLLHQAASGFPILTGASCSVRELRKGLDGPDSVRSDKSIVLVGFMGSGKSALGELLARKLGRRHLDTDEMIEKSAGHSVRDIFAMRGEAGFRAIEKSVVLSLDFAPDTVVSLGGGAVLDPDVLSVIKARTLSFWIYADPKAASARLVPGSRPLLEKEPGAAEALFLARVPAYAAAAKAVVINDGGPGDLESASERIIHEICPAIRS